MDEIVYMVGSLAAVTLLVGHVVRLLLVKLRPAATQTATRQNELESVCMELREELRQLREEQAVALDELVERVEFAERLLARTAQGESHARAVTPD